MSFSISAFSTNFCPIKTSLAMLNETFYMIFKHPWRSVLFLAQILSVLWQLFVLSCQLVFCAILVLNVALNKVDICRLDCFLNVYQRCIFLFLLPAEQLLAHFYDAMLDRKGYHCPKNMLLDHTTLPKPKVHSIWPPSASS